MEVALFSECAWGGAIYRRGVLCKRSSPASSDGGRAARYLKGSVLLSDPK